MIPGVQYHVSIVEQAVGSAGTEDCSAEPCDYSETPSGQAFVHHTVSPAVAITVRQLYLARGEDVEVCYDDDTGTMTVQCVPDFDEE
jgi:hypothetical protein